jgi:hypothetical protein
MIKTLSPYYIEIPLTSPFSGFVCGSYTVQVFIWRGARTAVPSQSTYQITKYNAVGLDGIEKVNIARIVNDFIEFNITPQINTGLFDSNNQAWVRFHVIYDVDPNVIQLQQTKLAIKGYGYFEEGQNPDVPSNKILLTQDEYKVNRDGIFVLPIQIEETILPDYNENDYTTDYFII